MRPEQFGREARRWAADHHRTTAARPTTGDLRAKRCVRVWDADDGTVQLHGTFDPVTGRRIGNRLRAEAARLYDADKKQSPDSRKSDRRTFDQCMADALDNLTNANSSRDGHNGGSGKPFADICVVAHLDEATGKLVAETPEGQRLPNAVLEELACNAKFTGVLYDHDGKPIWRAHSVSEPPPKPSARSSSPATAAASTAPPTPAYARSTTSNRSRKAVSPRSRTWSRCVGTATRRIHHHDWQIRTPRRRTLPAPTQPDHPRARERPRTTRPTPAGQPPPSPTLHPRMDASTRANATGPQPRALVDTPQVRPGPAAARAALQNARAKRNGHHPTDGGHASSARAGRVRGAPQEYSTRLTVHA